MLDIDASEVKVFMANFSTSSAVLNVEPLQQLLDSSEKEDKAVLYQIAKALSLWVDFPHKLNQLEQLKSLPKNEIRRPEPQTAPGVIQIGSGRQVTK